MAERDYSGAVASFMAALDLDPDNKTVQVEESDAEKEDGVRAQSFSWTNCG